MWGHNILKSSKTAIEGVWGVIVVWLFVNFFFSGVSPSLLQWSGAKRSWILIVNFFWRGPWHQWSKVRNIYFIWERGFTVHSFKRGVTLPLSSATPYRRLDSSRISSLCVSGKHTPNTKGKNFSCHQYPSESVPLSLQKFENFYKSNKGYSVLY